VEKKKIKKYKLLISFIFFIYFLLRLTNLNLQPVFCDEGIYIRWAQKIIQSPKENFFIPLSDGKTPLFMWLDTPFLKTIKNPLIAGKILSVLSGFATLLGAIYLGMKFFNLKTSIIAGFLFVFTPYILFFDRMALTDSMLAAFSFWSLIMAIEITNKPSLKKSIFLGIFLGLSILAKTPGIFNFLVLPLVLIKANFKDKEKLKNTILYLLISVILGTAIYNSLRISPDFKQLSSRNEYYHFPIKRLIEVPFNPLLGNLKEAFDFITKMATWPIFILFIIGLIYIIYKKEKTGLIIFLWGFIPFLILTSLLKVYTARYILPSVVPLIFIASYSLSKITDKIKNKFVVGSILIATFLPSFIFDYHLLNSPHKANLPAKEKEGYFEGWTAGYGLFEMAEFLKEKAKDKEILLVTAGAFGTLPDGIAIYLFPNKNITIWYGNSQIEPYVYEAAKEKETFFLVHKSNFVPNPNLTLIKEIPKPKWKQPPSDYLLLYKIEE
jgi:4-amino-4-deoxy-L-arabinose transferase-like glycosyltransferase